MVSMRPFASRLGRRVFETPWASGVRKAVVLREAASEAAFVKRQAEQFGQRAFDPHVFAASLEPKEEVDTLFILGSGSSIRDLTAANFDQIRSQRSVGINNWGIHSFVPDFYALESVPWVGDGKDFARAIGLLKREDIVKACPPLLVLRPRSGNDMPALASLPAAYENRVFFYGRVSPSTRATRNLSEDIGRVLRPLLDRYDGVFLDSGASIIRMVGVALSLGLTRIVLTGVDLNNTEYFWEENPDYDLQATRAGLVNNQKSHSNTELSAGVHETLSSSHRPFSVVSMIDSLRRALVRQFDVELLVSSERSALTGVLPTFRWHSDG